MNQAGQEHSAQRESPANQGSEEMEQEVTVKCLLSETESYIASWNPHNSASKPPF